MKVDGARPIVYPIDFDSTPIHFLTPEQGLALSLLRGDRNCGEAKRIFSALFPGLGGQVFAELVEQADEMVRSQPTPSGIGREGLLLRSDEPICDGQAFDPREFVVSTAEYAARAADTKRKLRLDTPIHIFTIFTHRCFTRCLYCYAEREPVKEMPLSRWREIVEEMERLGIVLSSPDNGDTFARPDGIEFLECLLEHKMHFLLSTKGHLIRETVARLVAAGFKKPVRGVIDRPVQLSVDAADEAVARRLLNVANPRIDLMLDTVENFLAFDIMPKIKAVITGLNVDQPKPIVDPFVSVGGAAFPFRALSAHLPPPYRRSVCESRRYAGAEAAVRGDSRAVSRCSRERKPYRGRRNHSRASPATAKAALGPALGLWRGLVRARYFRRRQGVSLRADQHSRPLRCGRRADPIDRRNLEQRKDVEVHLPGARAFRRDDLRGMRRV